MYILPGVIGYPFLVTLNFLYRQINKTVAMTIMIHVTPGMIPERVIIHNGSWSSDGTNNNNIMWQHVNNVDYITYMMMVKGLQLLKEK